MNDPRIDIAKPGKDIRTASQEEFSYSKVYSLMKIYRSIHTTSETSVAHGLSYPPQYLLMREITNSKYAYGLPELTANVLQKMPSTTGVDNTKLYFGPFSGFDSGTPVGNIDPDYGMWALLFIDPCKEPAVKQQSIHEKPVILVGTNADSVADYELNLDSKYDTLKVAKSGTLTLSIPAWDADPASYEVDPSTGFDYVQPTERTDSTSASHSLGYVPYYFPLIPYRCDVGEIYVYYEDIPTNININGLQTDFSPNYAWPREMVDEIVYVWIDNQEIHIDYLRRNWDPYSSWSFPARSASLKYTIFYNRVDEEFNLL